MAEASIEIRRATVEDARAIARVHVLAWREAYAHVFSKYLLENLDISTRAARWTRTITAGAVVWVAERDGEVIGWSNAGAARDPQPPAPCELAGIYVLAAEYGSGVGQLLLDAALGSSPAYLWVLGDNPRAQAFYRRNGFHADGVAKTDTFGGEPAHELRMVRTSVAAASS